MGGMSEIVVLQRSAIARLMKEPSVITYFNGLLFIQSIASAAAFIKAGNSMNRLF
jgi:hypothetical protein